MADFFGFGRKKPKPPSEPATSPSSSGPVSPTLPPTQGRAPTDNRRLSNYFDPSRHGPPPLRQSPDSNQRPIVLSEGQLTEEQVNSLFDQLLARCDITKKEVVDHMRSWDYDKKLNMITMDRKSELNVSGARVFGTEDTTAAPLLNVLAEKAGEMWSATVDAGSRAMDRHANRASTQLPHAHHHTHAHTHTHTHSRPLSGVYTPTPTGPSLNNPAVVSVVASPSFDTSQSDRNSPDYYIRKFMEPDLRGVTPSLVAHLEVSLRTRPIDWVMKFINLQGVRVVTNSLSHVNHKPESEKKDMNLDLEVEITKCVKVLLNSRWGIRETVAHPTYIHSIVFSVVCPHWQTRKFICDMLFFLCHCELPKGHEQVLRGFELLSSHRKDTGVFDGWLQDLEKTVDGRGKMGSLVGANEDLKRLGIYNAPDNHLMEYALSNMMLVNVLVKVPTDVNERIFLRTQLKVSGMERILVKLEALDYHLLNVQIDAYKASAENDMEDAFGDEISMYSEISQPQELLDLILDSISDAPRALDHLLGTFRSMLLIKGDPETKVYFYQLISEIVHQLVIDKRSSMNSENLGGSYSASVNSLIQKFSELDRLRQLEEEASENRELILRLTSENKELRMEMEYMKSNQQDTTTTSQAAPVKEETSFRRSLNAKMENASLRALLRTSRNTIAMLQEQLKEKNDSSDTSSISSASSPRLVLGNSWKMSGQNSLGRPQSSNSSVSVPAPTGYTNYPQNTGAVGAGGFFIPGMNASGQHPHTTEYSGMYGQPPQAMQFPGMYGQPPQTTDFFNVPPKHYSDIGYVPIQLNDPPTKMGGSFPPQASGGLVGPPPPPPPPPPLPTGPLRKELRFYPQVKLKNLQWQKLDSRGVQKTIWIQHDVDESRLEDQLDQSGVFSKIEDLFPAKVNNFFERRMKGKVEEKKDAIKFLSKEKSRNIIRALVIAVDDTLCNDTFLGNLIAYAPSKDDDLVKMNKYMVASDEECEELDIPEQFTVQMMKIYRYETRLQFMLFRLQFWERYDQLTKNMTVVLEVSDTLRHSSNIKELLCLILLLGNFMNASSLQGGAFGMRISSINKLADTKASNISSLSLLNVLAGVTRREFPHILAFLDDLSNAAQATRIMASINDMVQQYTEMRQSLKQLDAELGMKWQSEDVELEEGDRFLQVMSEHRESASNKFEELETLYINMDAKWKDVMLFYGENPKVMRPDDFFGIFAQFVAKWKDAAIQEEKFALRAEREEKRLLEEEERKARLQAKKEASAIDESTSQQRVEGVDISEGNLYCLYYYYILYFNPLYAFVEGITGTEDDRKMMDNLLAKLRTGESEVRTRRPDRSQKTKGSIRLMPALRSSESNATLSSIPSAEALLKSLQSD
ncbi:hypothetical protein BDF14DRAFT_1951245 [Spinellus fusiger]|nr:hypothetical protein BDF14DRAFT_1951245 [Spinellus fusiger]